MANESHANNNGLKNKPNEIISNKRYDKESIAKKPYVCCTCGDRFSKQERNFSYSQSPFFRGNNSFLPICNKCLEKVFEEYTDILGSKDDAIKRLCLRFDIYQSEDILNSSRKIDANRSRIKEYIRLCNLNQTLGKTYDDYLCENFNDTIMSVSDLDNYNKDNAEEMKRNVETWGLGYSEIEYKMLNEHFKLYEDRIDVDDPTQFTLLRDLCDQHILKYRAKKNLDIDRYEKLSKLYQQTISNADLKPKVKKDANSNNPDEAWGVFNKIIENFSPAEYYKDKDIFKDHDEHDEYYNRFIIRSTNNLINGTNIMDDEFSIKVTDDE